jgi:hypothetical protein
MLLSDSLLMSGTRLCAYYSLQTKKWERKMSDIIESGGSCLCGKIHIFSKSVNINAGTCHCSICRKWGGGPLFAIDGGINVTFDGEENISLFSSSKWAERGFCSQCGTHLFYRLKETQQYFLPAGLLDEEKEFVFDHEIFIEEKPSFYSFADKTIKMTGSEFFTMLKSAD